MDLTTTYLGLKLRNPLVPSACTLCEELGNLKKMEDAGAGAVVLHSLFEEQLRADSEELERHLDMTTDGSAEAQSYFPEPKDFKLGPEEYLEYIAKAKKALKIPVIASLNGVCPGEWTSYAKNIQQAGADALELNVYYIPTDPKLTSSDVEANYLSILKDVKKQVTIPVAFKLSPFFSNLTNIVQQIDNAGVQGLVLFNRFYQPDVDLDTMEVKPQVLWSTAQARRLPLRWIAILYGKVKADLAATSGIHNAQDVIKMLMVGAKATMLCSVLYKQGIEQIRVIEQELRAWLIEKEYESIQQLIGSMSQEKCPEPAAFERAQYMRTLRSCKAS